MSVLEPAARHIFTDLGRFGGRLAYTPSSSAFSLLVTPKGTPCVIDSSCETVETNFFSSYEPAWAARSF